MSDNLKQHFAEEVKKEIDAGHTLDASALLMEDCAKFAKHPGVLNGLAEDIERLTGGKVKLEKDAEGNPAAWIVGDVPLVQPSEMRAFGITVDDSVPDKNEETNHRQLRLNAYQKLITHEQAGA